MNESFVCTTALPNLRRQSLHGISWANFFKNFATWWPWFLSVKLEQVNEEMTI